MTLPDSLANALRRLDVALASLEAVAARRAEAEAERSDADEAFTALEDDRCRLALELDGALARLQTLDRAAETVSARLERAGATVRTVLADLDAGSSGPNPG